VPVFLCVFYGEGPLPDIASPSSAAGEFVPREARAGMVAAGTGWFSWVRAERALRRQEPLRAPTPAALIGAGIVVAGVLLVLGVLAELS